MTIESDAAASAAAAETIRKSSAGLLPEAAARMEAMATQIASIRYVARSRFTIDRKTGLLSALSTTRAIVDPGGPPAGTGHRRSRSRALRYHFTSREPPRFA